MQDLGGERRAGEVTRLLNELGQGRSEAAGELLPHIYSELRAIAEAYLSRERKAHTLQPTALVHEAFLRLSLPGQGGVSDRKHFYALAAKVMRQVLVDHARRRHRRDHALGRLTLILGAGAVPTGADPIDLLDLDHALGELVALDERQARIVELRFFGGLEVQDVADVMEVSKSTVEREWRSARAWLGLRLEGSHGGGSNGG